MVAMIPVRSASAAAMAVAATLLPGAAVALPPGAAVAASASLAEVPPYHPSRLIHLGVAEQVVVVTARGWRSSHAVLRRYARSADGTWRQVGDAVRARVGRNGFVPAADRRQDTGTSPAGTFPVVSAFGNGADPGAALPYRRVDRDDWWVYDPRDPRTYNLWQPRRPASARWRTRWAEDLSGFGAQYRYAAVLAFNMPAGVHRDPAGERVADEPADTRRGGGIFLHVNGPGATSGCVSTDRATMRRTLRWLDPDRHPVLVMGPRSAIDRL